MDSNRKALLAELAYGDVVTFKGNFMQHRGYFTHVAKGGHLVVFPLNGQGKHPRAVNLRARHVQEVHRHCDGKFLFIFQRKPLFLGTSDVQVNWP